MNETLLVDPGRLAEWMRAEGLTKGSVWVERITTGHSNEVFLVHDDDREWVLRRPPRTPLSPTAHDMAREYRVLDALQSDARVRVPNVVALCTDTDVIGAPFYLMNKIDGVVVRERVPQEIADPASPRAAAFAMIDALADIHDFDWAGGGLDGFGKPDGYLERQVPRWLGQLEKYKTRELPEVEEAGRWLAAHTPAMQAPGLLHGDYKLDNVMFAPHLPVELIAVVDWEQSTIGDPLVDLGWVIGLWLEPGEGATLAGASPFPPGSDVPTRADLIGRYADRGSRDVSNIAFYCVLGLFKLACVMEGSCARFKAGTSDDAYFAALDQGVPALARRALDFTT